MKNYCRRLKDLREDHDFTQEGIAQILEISQQYYSEYELGKREFPIRHLIKLAELYQVSTDYILGLSKEQKKSWLEAKQD